MNNIPLDEKIKQQLLKNRITAYIGIPLLIVILMFGCPEYKVWKAGRDGAAEMAQANQNRQIKIIEAEAARDAAAAYAAADTIRAHGVAISNKIIGNSLRNNDMYLHYLWLQTLEHNKGDVIYIPTEANFPIMEAGRFTKQLSKQMADTSL